MPRMFKAGDRIIISPPTKGSLSNMGGTVLKFRSVESVGFPVWTIDCDDGIRRAVPQVHLHLDRESRK